MFFFTKKNANYQKLSVSDALKMMNDKDVLILDVRTASEYNSRHIKRAINIPVDDIDRALDVITNKEQTILVYCQSGARSMRASNKLLSLDYKNVYDIGGITSFIGVLE